ncbi:PREDICTED: protein FAR-RED IMPAIRED RESPONSE 1-like [Nelumbo nucifera]|uniref:Protein FAR1-RELATED SEQUENCE n=2 Tax=Nelumbo nucifera TaxID=4432 RepID=A0A1U8Q3M9_NELNU|nr:PREDICTED: protein FAR-RED IMPAIRED RESPONSE 1-like [Nelumbo nucifera]XP_010250363.1 PREDICTED: protein FAR-RED IMPAIRED RESPONSE 1-like [Nelumbo nucifera]XP_019052636.1 PREDICTED: protein FAR-RED IMPAIRED RESPONSE 1-like [Nelumbo nucifera]XP_019052640.1 PREDICTED: protein FAR-RED IMPAIRED RESPONSE 1-like [Nelumbo nucifera]DAD36027.1 TPA_asm: hypothetical protein HUJ06_006667 [Nelumbo nucifera]
MEVDLDVSVDGSKTNDVGQNVDGIIMNDGDIHGEDEGGVDFPLPCKGMEFGSLEEAYSFYREYARIVGFDTLKKSTSCGRNREFTHATFACSREGKKKQTIGVRNPRPCYKVGCKASMHVSRRKHGKWAINNFNNEHNHELQPIQARYLRGRRSTNPTSKDNTDILHAFGVHISNIYAAMVKQCGGYQDVDFSEDMGDHFDRECRLAVNKEEAQVLLNYFTNMQEHNSSFFYAIDLNDEQCLRNVLWVDAKARHDYVNFGDVVCFDTTYLTNRYKMPFAPFIGVNNHCQPTLLGCALIADGTTSRYVWLMKTWLRAMGGVAPKVIVTDQDDAIKAAITQVFPSARHRFCLWHILSKVPQNLSHVIKRHVNFMGEFKKCIYRSWTEEEFEDQWLKMIQIFELGEDEWLKSLYEDRKLWVPTYMTDTFFAGMSTVQRSQSIYDKYVHKETTVKEFLKQYKIVLQDMCEKEYRADYDSWHGIPVLQTCSPYEKQMSTTYTTEVFKKFQVEVLEIVSCQVRKEKEDGTTTTFKVKDFEEQDDFIVAWDETKSVISCLCRCFEYNGFLCRHAMAVLHTSAVPKIPSHYILNRWTKDVKSGQAMNQISGELQCRIQRCNDICQRVLKLIEYGSISQDSYNVVVRGIVETLMHCESFCNPI